ncbi:phytanoyl-CoA dioxygenase family protein [Flavobacterium silvaticum]|nr:phytanoyl-CoA dioxygenase family protein [Flavobacterium silvaticum]
MELEKHKEQITEIGFSIIPDIYSREETDTLISIIEDVDTSKENFRKSANLFAIRQFLKEVPKVENLVFTDALKQVITDIFGTDFFVVKSIYFDKPETSNWYVAYHQDLTISVDKKIGIDNFGPWTVKQNQFAVQPPIKILENNFTIRIHLDDTNENNGALKVIEKSHSQGIYRPETINFKTETETICSVPAGGIMIMKPLLLHGSNRTANQKKRRVIHVEFSNVELPGGLKWSERLN